MNPLLLQALMRLGPRAAGMLNGGFGLRAGMIQTPDVTPVGVPGAGAPGALSPGGTPSVPISQSNYAPPTPNSRVSAGFDMFHPSASNGVPTMASQNLPTSMDVPSTSPSPVAQAAPMPAPRPQEAPQPSATDNPGPMGFLARNSAMMTDPSSGAFIDPLNAARAQASGPDVIAKLLQYFHNKDHA